MPSLSSIIKKAFLDLATLAKQCRQTLLAAASKKLPDSAELDLKAKATLSTNGENFKHLEAKAAPHADFEDLKDKAALPENGDDLEESETTEPSTSPTTKVQKFNEFYRELKQLHFNEIGRKLFNFKIDAAKYNLDYAWGSKDELKYLPGLEAFLDAESNEEELILVQRIDGKFYEKKALMMSHDQGAVIVGDEIFPEAFARIIRFLTAPDPFPLKRKKEIETIQLDRALTDEQDKELKEINQMTYTKSKFY